MRFDILSLFPGYFKGPFDESILKRAQESGKIEIHLVDIRDFADNKWRKVDDRPYGGGPGMIMMAEPVVKAIRKVKTEKSWVVYLTPQGIPFSAQKARELSEKEHVVLLAGHYEGIDERALELEVDEEISIGDYVLSNGCIAAIVVVDAVARFVPGVIGHDVATGQEAARQDSFEEGYFDCPHYTRPENFEGLSVPPILLSGDHKKIADWRRKQGVDKTRRVRPEILE